MEEIFVSKILIKEVLGIKDFEIPLSDGEKKHLIITGKNGSGKTSVLNELKVFLNRFEDGQASNYSDNVSNLEIFKSILLKEGNRKEDIAFYQNALKDRERWLRRFGKTILHYNNNDFKNISQLYKEGEYIIAFFEARRNITLEVPTGINKVDVKPYYTTKDSAGKDFIQYIVNLKADRSFAKDDNDVAGTQKIDEWFEVFEENIFKLFDAENASLEFDRKSYNFNIIEPGKPPYSLNQLSDGYSSILNIVTELIIRMEEHKTKVYDVQGIVLIDEIETHLHIELQKKILPFLTSFFPKIQFIVTTHSPFVINSIDNAVVCDLEKKIVTSDLSAYSYEAIVESYFDSDKYSTILKERLAEYEHLLSKNNLNEEDSRRLIDLKAYFDKTPKFFADELIVKLQQIKLKELNKKLMNDTSAKI